MDVLEEEEEAGGWLQGRSKRLQNFALRDIGARIIGQYS